MSRPRTELGQILEDILGSSNVYFQAPESMKLKFPCIMYELNSGDTEFADNIPYIYKKRYQVTVIDKNPDSKIPDKVAQLPACTFSRYFRADNLNHYVFNLYF